MTSYICSVVSNSISIMLFPIHNLKKRSGVGCTCTKQVPSTGYLYFYRSPCNNIHFITTMIVSQHSCTFITSICKGDPSIMRSTRHNCKSCIVIIFKNQSIGVRGNTTQSRIRNFNVYCVPQR